MMRHVLGIMGVIAAGILLAVSAAMNYRFGFSLGKSAIDGQIYGLASAAADCFKALVPFFFFAAVRNKMWSQALAAALVWTVVTGYSMTSLVCSITVLGMSRPIARSVLRLRTRSNRVGSSTGNSAILAPRRTRSMKLAERSMMSCKFDP